MPEFLDYYQLLGVAYDDPPEKIKAKYRLLAFSLHIDIVGKERAGDLTPYTEAYDVLCDPESRQRYNAQLGIIVRPRALLEGTDLYQRIYITPDEAHWGATTNLTFIRYEPCALCWLAGCHRCAGQGMRAEQITLGIQVPPNTRNGQMILMEGHGGRAEPGGTRGNLIVYVTMKFAG